MRKTDAHIKKRKDFSTVMHNIAANVAKQGDPVAVVYYRCEQQGTKYIPHGDLYYVHNGVALEDLPYTKGTNERMALISHVAEWPHTNEVYIFGEHEAAQAVKDGPGKICCGSKEEGPIIKDSRWRPWIWVAIHPYSQNHQPIAWMVDNDTKDPHNGVLNHLDCPKKEECTLHYWHFKNTKINHDNEKKGENARTVYDPNGNEWQNKFNHSPESELFKAGQTPKGSLTIATQPPVTKPRGVLISYPMTGAGGLTIATQPETKLSPCPQ